MCLGSQQTKHSICRCTAKDCVGSLGQNERSFQPPEDRSQLRVHGLIRAGGGPAAAEASEMLPALCICTTTPSPTPARGHRYAFQTESQVTLASCQGRQSGREEEEEEEEKEVEVQAESGMQWLCWIKGGAGLWSRRGRGEGVGGGWRGSSHAKAFTFIQSIWEIRYCLAQRARVCVWKWKLCYTLRSSLCGGGHWRVVATADPVRVAALLLELLCNGRTSLTLYGDGGGALWWMRSEEALTSSILFGSVMSLLRRFHHNPSCLVWAPGKELFAILLSSSSIYNSFTMLLLYMRAE